MELGQKVNIVTEFFKSKEKGSVCLIAHHMDITFGDVFVKPIAN